MLHIVTCFQPLLFQPVRLNPNYKLALYNLTSSAVTTSPTGWPVILSNKNDYSQCGDYLKAWYDWNAKDSQQGTRITLRASPQDWASSSSSVQASLLPHLSNALPETKQTIMTNYWGKGRFKILHITPNPIVNVVERESLTRFHTSKAFFSSSVGSVCCSIALIQQIVYSMMSLEENINQ